MFILRESEKIDSNCEESSTIFKHKNVLFIFFLHNLEFIQNSSCMNFGGNFIFGRN